MWMYLAVFAAALGVDLIPVFAPPAWTAMVFFLVKFNLNPWGVLVAGVIGSTLGRYLFSLYIPKVSAKIIKCQKNEELEFVGEKLGGSLWKTWLFVFIYTLTPLSTTALFTAAALAKVKPLHTLPPFFVGKFVSDAIMIVTGSYAATNFKEFVQGIFSPKGIIFLVLGLVMVFGFLFVDWRELLEKKTLKFRFRIWK